jgi:hypothetical protein
VATSLSLPGVTVTRNPPSTGRKSRDGTTPAAFSASARR